MTVFTSLVWSAHTADFDRSDIYTELYDAFGRGVGKHSAMEDEQKKKILSFLSRCQNDEMAQTTSIARYLGLTDARRVLSLLRQMTSEGLIKKTGNRW